jgi:hypothetical protein
MMANHPLQMWRRLHACFLGFLLNSFYQPSVCTHNCVGCMRDTEDFQMWENWQVQNHSQQLHDQALVILLTSLLLYYVFQFSSIIVSLWMNHSSTFVLLLFGVLGLGFMYLMFLPFVTWPLLVQVRCEYSMAAFSTGERRRRGKSDRYSVVLLSPISWEFSIPWSKEYIPTILEGWTFCVYIYIYLSIYLYISIYIYVGNMQIFLSLSLFLLVFHTFPPLISAADEQWNCLL